ncbi:unnamed protein product [Ostreobium quekettii]|uniref:J domain-containing protein n=1 Tax=Ostreobium quekettii TaxID=121088 RepID=A0A8S1JFZ3_9CHLO|nr:unnamed protein product [Ostreobium quekettii]
MARRGNDAFEGLISSVPGLDTSGFVKRSMNEQKAATRAACPAAGRPEAVWGGTGGARQVQMSTGTGVAGLTGQQHRQQGLGVRSGMPSSMGGANAARGRGMATPAAEGFESAAGRSGFGRSPPSGGASCPAAGRAGRGGAESSLDSLMASVQGLDTSGFVKRSLNDLRAGGGAGDAAGGSVSQRPAAGAGRSADAVGIDRAQPDTLDLLGGKLQDSAPRGGGASGLGDAWASPPLGGGAAPIVSVSADELDALSAPAPTAGPAVSSAGFVDLFDGIPGGLPEEPPPQPAPKAAQQTRTRTPANRGDDLLGMGSQDISNLEALNIGDVFSPRRLGVSQAVNYGEVEDEGIRASEASPLTADLIPNTPPAESAPAPSQRSIGSIRQRKPSKEAYAAVCTNPDNSDEEWATASEEGSPSPRDNPMAAGYQGFGGGDGDLVGSPKLPAVGEDEEVVEVKRSKAPVFGKLSRGVAKELKKGLGKLQKSRGGEEKDAKAERAAAVDAEQPKEREGMEEEGRGGFKAVQSRALKYGQNLGKAAMQLRDKGLEAVKQSLEVAQDWMDKGLEARKKSEEPGSIEEHSANVERPHATGPRVDQLQEDDDYADIVEMAAELQNLPYGDRSLAVSEMEPEIQVKVVELLRSQGVEVMAGAQHQPTHFNDGRMPGSGSLSPPATAVTQPPSPGFQRAVSDNALSRDEKGLWDDGPVDDGSGDGNLGSPMGVERSSSLPELGEVDLLNLGSLETSPKAGAGGAGASTAAKVVCAANPDDLGDFFQGTGPSAEVGVAGISAAVDVPCTSNPDDLGTFFQSSVPVPPPSPQPEVDDFFGASSSQAGCGQEGGSAVGQLHVGSTDELMTFDGPEHESKSQAAAAAARHSNLYANKGGEEGEPEVRRMLRTQREQKKHAKMVEALETKIRRDQEEVERQEAQHEYKEAYVPMIQAWKDQHRANIRGMLTSLHTMLWEGTSWKILTVADVLEPGQVKKAYMKANLIVHPDKVRQKNGTNEQVVIADMVFDALKEAWNEFQKG